MHHVALLVDDLEAAERFYTEVLALPIERRWPAPGGGVRSVWLELGGGARLMLERATGPLPGRGAAGWTLLALAITPEARERWRAWFAAAGVAIDQETERTLYVRDPEGNRVALSCWPAPGA